MWIPTIVLAATLTGVCPPDLTARLHDCARGRAPGCAELRRELGACFGTATDGDRRVGDALATRLLALLAHPPQPLASAVQACASGDCLRLGGVVAQLFSGGDQALDRSKDRSLGRALAELIVGQEEDLCESR